MKKCRTISEHFSMTIPQMHKALDSLWDGKNKPKTIQLNVRGLVLYLDTEEYTFNVAAHPYDGEGARLSDYSDKKSKKFC